jgi:hypothetical protein
MSADRSSRIPQDKPFAVTILRIGSHPLVYSIAVVLAIGALAFFLAIVPLVRMLQSGGKASIPDAQARNRIALNSLNAEKKLAGAASSLSSDDQALLTYAMPGTPDTPGLAVILKSLALRSGVKLYAFDISEPPPEPNASILTSGRVQITMSLNLVTYDRLKLVLMNLENSLRIFDLRSFTFSPTAGSMNVEFDAYYLNNG